MNSSNSGDKKLSVICSITRPDFWYAGCKLRELWASPIGNHNYFLAQYPLSILSQQGLIVTKIDVELNIEVDSKEDSPHIMTISPNLDTDFNLNSVPSSQNLINSSIINLGGGTIGNTGIPFPAFSLELRPDIIGLIKGESNKAVWFISSGPLWRILKSSQIKGLYLLKAIFAIPLETSEIISRLHVNVYAKERLKQRIYKFYNDSIFPINLDHKGNFINVEWTTSCQND